MPHPSLASHTARPLRRRSHRRAVLRRLAMLEHILSYVCRVLASRIPQVLR